jgi:hypothetical protein
MINCIKDKKLYTKEGPPKSHSHPKSLIDFRLVSNSILCQINGPLTALRKYFVALDRRLA